MTDPSTTRKPLRPGATQPAPAIPVPPSTARTGPVRAAGQHVRDAALHHDIEDSQRDETQAQDFAAWSSILRQGPSWLTSLVVHMVLILVLALCVSGPAISNRVKELVIGKPDVAKTLDDPKPSELPTAPPDTELPPMPTAPDLPEPVSLTSNPLSTPNNEPHLAAMPVLLDPLGSQAVVIGDGPSPGQDKDGPGGLRNTKRIICLAPPRCITAVEAALAWLADHQNSDGSWSFPHTPGGRCNGFPNPGNAQTRMGATGLALLAFLGAGYTHHDGPDGPDKVNKYRENVRRGLNYLVGNMKVSAEGGRLFDEGGAGHYHMYSHGIAACALAEAHGMTKDKFVDKRLQEAAQLALNYIVSAQDSVSGGWLYTPRAGGDTSVVGWQVMAVKSGLLAYLEVPRQVKPLASKWLDSVSWDDGAAYGYRGQNDRPSNDACTAIGLLCRNYLGWKKDHPGLIAGVQRLADRGPSPDNMYYNYYAAMVMYQNDGPRGALWKAWDKKMQAQLLGTQVKEGKQRGSWHFDGGHGDAGGRVYNTAMAAMTLEVYYRYLPVYQQGNVALDNFPVE